MYYLLFALNLIVPTIFGAIGWVVVRKINQSDKKAERQAELRATEHKLNRKVQKAHGRALKAIAICVKNERINGEMEHAFDEMDEAHRNCNELYEEIVSKKITK